MLQVVIITIVDLFCCRFIRITAWVSIVQFYVVLYVGLYTLLQKCTESVTKRGNNKLAQNQIYVAKQQC